MKVKTLMQLLAEMPPDAEVRTRAENARSRMPFPELGEGYESSYLYVLPEGYSGFSEAKERGKTFPVVWL